MLNNFKGHFGTAMMSSLTLILYIYTHIPHSFMVSRCWDQFTSQQFLGLFFHLLPTKTCSCQLCWHLQQRGNEFPCEANSSRMNWMKAELIIAHYWKHFWFKKKKKKEEIFLSTSPVENCWERCFWKAIISKHVIIRSLNKKHTAKEQQKILSLK